MASAPSRNWHVLLLGGASGTGKSSLSYPLAHHFGVALTEVDDIVIALQKSTTPQQLPLLHYWDTHPEAQSFSPEQILDLHLSVCRALAPALHAIIANHLESQTPVILDGDYILPELLADHPTQVKALFLSEPSEEQIVQNYLAREPHAGRQTGRAHVSWLLNQWLSAECARYNIPTLAPRPWPTLLERAITSLTT